VTTVAHEIRIPSTIAEMQFLLNRFHFLYVFLFYRATATPPTTTTVKLGMHEIDIISVCKFVPPCCEFGSDLSIYTSIL
jgi:hypothetical protein